MLQQRNELDFNGQNIYVGIDVHLKSWTVTILTETQPHKTFSQPPKPEVLAGYLEKHFPNGSYHSAYEAGFSGFWAHYRLMSLGIKNIVINPADVPTTQKEHIFQYFFSSFYWKFCKLFFFFSSLYTKLVINSL